MVFLLKTVSALVCDRDSLTVHVILLERRWELLLGCWGDDVIGFVIAAKIVRGMTNILAKLLLHTNADKKRVHQLDLFVNILLQ